MRRFFALLLMLLCAAAIAEVQFYADKETVSKDGTVFLTASGLPPGDFAVKVYDGAGQYVCTLMNKFNTGTRLLLRWKMKDAAGNPVPPGSYTIRMRVGTRLMLDTAFGKGGMLTAGTDPVSLRVDRKGDVYVLDKDSSTVYKYHADGSPANDFNGKNMVMAMYLKTPAQFWGSLALDDDGRMYLPATYATAHWIDVLDPTGKELYYIGGFFGTDRNWETDQKGGTAYPGWAGIGAGPRLYATSWSYQMICAWDATKEKKLGAVWGTSNADDQWRQGFPGVPGSAGDTDGKRAIYLNAATFVKHSTLTKLVDNDAMVQCVYASTSYPDLFTKKDIPLEYIYGITCDREDGIYCALRKASRMVKFHDTGLAFEPILQFGEVGNDPGKLQFATLHAVAPSFDGKALYILEDGETVLTEEMDKAEKDRTPNAPTGPARLIKYKVSYEGEGEAKVTVQ